MNNQKLAALPPRDRPYKVGVGGSMFLLINPNGSKYWRFRYHIAGREKGLSLGVFPAVSLADAMKDRDRMKAQLRAGVDPTNPRHAERLRRIEQLTRSSSRDLHLQVSKGGALTIGSGSRRLRLTSRQTNALRAFLLSETSTERVSA